MHPAHLDRRDGTKGVWFWSDAGMMCQGAEVSDEARCDIHSVLGMKGKIRTLNERRSSGSGRQTR